MERVPNDFCPATFATLREAELVASYLSDISYPRRPDPSSWWNEHYCTVQFIGRRFMVEGKYEPPAL